MAEQLTALGTGFAIASKCYTTCFTISDGNEHFMIDAGGGNGVLTNLEKLNISYNQVHHIFLSHCHNDHIMGAVWMLRMIGQSMGKGIYEGNLHMYCHKEIADGLLQMSKFMLSPKLMPLFGERIIFHCLADGMTFDINGRKTTFFDTKSHKAIQYGVKVELLNGKSITYLGDEPYNPECEQYAKGVDYLMHEALCLEADEEKYHPHKISHSTVKDAADWGVALAVPNLILHHTEDRAMETRKARYTAEAKQYYNGTVFVPDDLEIIEL
jgi:ribonuclease Z